MADEPAKLLRFVDGTEINPDKPHEGVVELLRRALAEAEAGKTRTVAIVKFDRVGAYSTNYDGESPMTSIIGACRMLEHDLIRDYERYTEKSEST